MLPRTPQKKNSLELQPKSQPQSHSYIFTDSANNANVVQESKLFGAHDRQPWGQLQQSSPSHNNNSKVWQVKQYVHQEIQNRHGKHSQQKEKYRDVVISEEFVRSHKLYRMLKQQMELSEARHAKNSRELQQVVASLHSEVKESKQANHELKVQLWQHKTELMDLKTMLQQEEEQNKKLAEQYEYASRERGDENDNEDEEAQNLEDKEIQLDNSQNEQNQQQNGRFFNCYIEEGNQKRIEARLLKESEISLNQEKFEPRKQVKQQKEDELQQQNCEKQHEWQHFQSENGNLSLNSQPKIDEDQ